MKGPRWVRGAPQAAVLGRFGPRLWFFWVVFGPIWGLWAAFGRFLAFLGSFLGFLGSYGSIFGVLGAFLVPFFGLFGSFGLIFGIFWFFLVVFGGFVKDSFTTSCSDVTPDSPKKGNSLRTYRKNSRVSAKASSKK